jgi:cystathionine beta-lyase family protein involved in aluminum resistance
MAAGTFIQGASLELSADAPMREPFAVYLQGGLSRYYSRLAVIKAASLLAQQ